MDTPFGQEKKEKSRPCLNGYTIRTREGEKINDLSEWIHYSDKRRRKKPIPV